MTAIAQALQINNTLTYLDLGNSSHPPEEHISGTEPDDTEQTNNPDPDETSSNPSMNMS